MKTLKLISLCIILATFTACEDYDIFGGGDRQEASAFVSGLDGNDVSGTAHFTETDDGVRLVLHLENLSPGEHGVHLHTGTCDNIGGHWNPTNEPHGLRGADNTFHRGDIGNIAIGKDGKGTLTLTADDWTIGGSDDTNIVGRLVIVHAGTDNYVTQPGGSSGPTIGCGTVQH